MATLTYDPTPADQPEFNEQEKEALAIGEAAEQAQNEMLAGKFKDAEALEQAYLELQSKLGKNEQETSEQEPEESSTQPEETSNEVTTQLIQASREYQESGKLSSETLETLQGMDSKELLEAYMDIQQNYQGAPDLSEKEVMEVQATVGGEKAYGQLVNWASENLDPQFVQAFDNLINTGDVNMIKLAAAGLQSAYDNSNGREGQMLTGKGAPIVNNGFRSQAEVVAAMQDPRYDKDPAYRADVFARLEQSNIDY